MANAPAWLQSFINGPLFDPKYWRISNPAARAANEGGIDIPGSGGEAITALADGVIIGAGNFWYSGNLYTPGSGKPGYGVVTERVTSPGGQQNDLYYQHIQLNPNIKFCNQGSGPCTGQVVNKGDVLGWIVPGIGETEVGINANWGGVWGSSHPSTSLGWVDPEPFLRSVVSGGALPVSGAGLSNCNCNPIDRVRCAVDLLTAGARGGQIDPTCTCCNDQAAASQPVQGAATILDAGSSLGTFFSQLQQPGTWIRVGAVAIGIIIIAIAVWKMI